MSDASASDSNANNFVRMHQGQLQHANIPPFLWSTLDYKLANDVFDAGSYFRMEQHILDETNDDDNNDDDENADSGKLSVVATKPISAHATKGQKAEGKDGGIFVIDHAWSFTDAAMARQQLQYYGLPLVERLERILQFKHTKDNDDDDEEEEDLEKRIARILHDMWSQLGMYRMGGSNGEMQCVWFLMDEFGAAIPQYDHVYNNPPQLNNDENQNNAVHSNHVSPNVALVPFFDLRKQMAYSILFPLREIQAGDVITTNHLPSFPSGAKSKEEIAGLRTAMLYGLFPNEKYYKVQFEKWFAKQHHDKSDMDKECTTQKNTTETTDRKATFGNERTISEPLFNEQEGPIRIYTDLRVLKQCLTDPHFQVLLKDDDTAPPHDASQSTPSIPPQADVYWSTERLPPPSTQQQQQQQQQQQTHYRVVNQFPNERVLTCKDLMYQTCVRHYQNSNSHGEQAQPHHPPWLAETYDLETQLSTWLHTFHHHQHGQQEQQNHNNNSNNNDNTNNNNDQQQQQHNYWILKPYNSSRSRGITITNSSAHVMKRHSCYDGIPKIVSKYIQNPVLIKGRKFDLRYFLLLSWTAPSATLRNKEQTQEGESASWEAWVSHVAYPRVALEEFTMQQVENANVHLTVSKYRNSNNKNNNNATQEEKEKEEAAMMSMEEFITEFESTYNTGTSAGGTTTTTSWKDVQASIDKTLVALVQGVLAQPPPGGMMQLDNHGQNKTKNELLEEQVQAAAATTTTSNATYRALYGVDVMLSHVPGDNRGGDGRMQPIVLEVNYMPDCIHPCRTHPHFFNDVMNVLLRGVSVDDTVHGMSRLDLTEILR